MLKKTKVILILLFFSAAVSAQNITGSPFSAFGYGIIEDLSTGTSQSFGGASVGLSLSDEINTQNPAGYGSIPRQTFLFNAGLKGRQVTYDNGATSATKYDNGFTGLNAAFNIAEHWSAGFGIMPYSSIGYKIKTQDSIFFDDLSYGSNTNYYGEGGLNKVYLTTAFNYGGFSAGIDFSYIFGVLGARIESSVTDPFHSGFLLNTNNLNMKGLYMTYGLQYKYMISESQRITFGATYNHTSSLKSRRTQLTKTILTNQYTNVSDTLVQDTLFGLNAELPQAFAVGVSYQTKKWLFAADYSTKLWEGISIDERPVSELTNSYKVSGGVEYAPSLTPENYLQAVRYRIGGYYTNDYILVNGNPLAAYAVTFGIGLPARKSRTMINLGFEIGQKGDINKNLLKETYYGLNVSLNMSDIWFIQRKFD
jgi:hypothetical protein